MLIPMQVKDRLYLSNNSHQCQSINASRDCILLKYIFSCFNLVSTSESLGCWKDDIPRAMKTLEGKSSKLTGHYRSRSNAIEKCLQAAVSFGYKVFAVQDGGQCFGDVTAAFRYKHYGPSRACSGNGKGGPMANQVYKVSK